MVGLHKILIKMDTKAFEEKVLKILNNYLDDYIVASNLPEAMTSEITSLIEPFIEGWKAYEELDKLPLSDEILDKELELRQRINELKKQIEE